MPIFHLLYHSSASPTLEFKDLEDILVISRMSNAFQGITGFLIYRDHAFLQLIEGEESRIRELLEKIRRDPRNFNVRVLAEVESEERLMPKWSMAWVDPQQVGLSSKKIFELLELANPKEGLLTRSAVLALLREFSQGAQSMIDV